MAAFKARVLKKPGEAEVRTVGMAKEYKKGVLSTEVSRVTPLKGKDVYLKTLGYTKEVFETPTKIYQAGVGLTRQFTRKFKPTKEWIKSKGVQVIKPLREVKPEGFDIETRPTTRPTTVLKQKVTTKAVAPVSITAFGKVAKEVAIPKVKVEPKITPGIIPTRLARAATTQKLKLKTKPLITKIVPVSKQQVKVATVTKQIVKPVTRQKYKTTFIEGVKPSVKTKAVPKMITKAKTIQVPAFRAAEITKPKVARPMAVIAPAFVWHWHCSPHTVLPVLLLFQPFAPFAQQN